MRPMTEIAITAGCLASLALAAVANADTVDARCDIYPRGEDRASASLGCHFSQRQGRVYIAREDGVDYDLVPIGDSPGNYRDATGKPAYRQSGLGNAGVIFRLSHESVFVYWDKSPLRPAGVRGD